MAVSDLLNHTTTAPQAADADFFIEEFLAAAQAKDLLRFSTAGSVDDGKSTLIGRLLYDSHNVYEDHVRAVTRTHGQSTTSTIDFAQLTDGLRAEREQGITIDVAYRYFSTARRNFIIADTPGHEQYTRNMATGASTADLAIILVDARKGILTQSRRHAYIASLLGIPHIVAAINKMDLVGYSEQVYEQHCTALLDLAASLGIENLVCIPVSALEGDNVVNRSDQMPWYTGPSLLEHLETVPVHQEAETAAFRLPVQRVIRPDQHFRGFAGQISAGSVRPGETVLALPSGRRSRVKSISTFDGDLDVAAAPLSITLTLEDELDISRGDMIVSVDAAPQGGSRFQASTVWMNAEPLELGKTYLLKHTTQSVRAQVVEIDHRVNIHTLEKESASSLEMNEIGVLQLETSRLLFVDPYRENRTTGSFILIDPATNATVAAGMIREVLEGTGLAPQPEEIHRSWTHGAALVNVANNPALAAALEQALLAHDCAVVRTRVQEPKVWRALLDAGLISIVEADMDREPDGQVQLLTSRENGASFETDTVTFSGEATVSASVEQILNTLESLQILKGREKSG